MAFRWLTALGLMLGLHVEPGNATRQLEVEVDVQHIGGLLESTELEGMLASSELTVEATYHPLRLIEGVTATRQKTLPIGSRLYPIAHHLQLRDEQIVRSGRTLRFRLDEHAPDREGYRLLSLALHLPLAAAPGRPQPRLSIELLSALAENGAHQQALFTRHGAFDLGMRVRYRWSDAQGEPLRQPPTCAGDVIELDPERYLFRPRHRFAGYFEQLQSVVQSDPPSSPPPGQRSFQLREPYPEPLAGWTLSRNHLVQLSLPQGMVERISLYAKQQGPGHCQRTRLYEMLFADGSLVSLERGQWSMECDGVAESLTDSQHLSAQWREDESLMRFMLQAGDGAAPRLFDAFNARQPAACGATEPPLDHAQLQALLEEARQLREAFLRP